VTPVGALDPDRIQSHLRTLRFGRSLDVRQETRSTNDDAREAAEGGAPDGHTVVTDEQTRGRGARGRAWSSPPGTDLYFSVVVRPAMDAAALPTITLAAGLAVAEAVDRVRDTGPRASVKWPNDVLLDGRKCAGVLAESTSVGQRVSVVVIGIGLNVNRQSWPEELGDTATSLALASGGTFDREAVLAEVLADLERWVDLLASAGPACVCRALEGRLAWRGRWVRVDGIEGRVAGVASTGALELDTEQGRRSVTTGSPVLAP